MTCPGHVLQAAIEMKWADLLNMDIPQDCSLDGTLFLSRGVLVLINDECHRGCFSLKLQNPTVPKK